MEIPNDLVPLPTQPWAERPADLPLDIQECRTAIWMNRGNITEAAKLLKISSLRLRNFVRNSPFLSAEVEEALEQLVDIAEDVAYQALTDENDPGRRDSMARAVLASQGKKRGWGSGTGGVSVKMPGNGRMVIEWADGSSVSGGDDAKLIEHEEAS